MEMPSLWVAPNSTLTTHRGNVNVPAQMTDVRPGVELGIVVGSSVHAVDPNDALDAVGGFTVCMDIAAHDDIPGLEGYRMFDTSLPCGRVSSIQRQSIRRPVPWESATTVSRSMSSPPPLFGSLSANSSATFRM